MNLYCPDLPEDEKPLLPVADCTCYPCRQLREELAAAALVNLIEQARRTFESGTTDAASEATGAGLAIGAASEPGKSKQFLLISPVGKDLGPS